MRLLISIALLWICINPLASFCQENDVKKVKGIELILGSIRFCDELKDSCPIYNKLLAQDTVYCIFDSLNSVYFQLHIEHRGIVPDDNFNYNFHYHSFKPIKIDSFPPLYYNWTNILKTEVVKEFEYYLNDTVNEKFLFRYSHECTLLLNWKSGTKLDGKEYYPLSFQKSYTMLDPDRKYSLTINNINYEYNKNLVGVLTIFKIYQLAKQLIDTNKLELEDK